MKEKGQINGNPWTLEKVVQAHPCQAFPMSARGFCGFELIISGPSALSMHSNTNRIGKEVGIQDISFSSPLAVLAFLCMIGQCMRDLYLCIAHLSRLIISTNTAAPGHAAIQIIAGDV
jgi:hypothetical protein